MYCRVFGEYEALGQLVKNRLSNMSAPSSTLWAYWSVRSDQELSWKVLLVPTSSPLVIGLQVRTQSDLCISSVSTAINYTQTPLGGEQTTQACENGLRQLGRWAVRNHAVRDKVNEIFA